MSSKQLSISKKLYYNVLLIEEDPKEVELFSELIQAVGECKIDVISQAPNIVDWIGRLNYHLIVIADFPSS